MKHFIRVFSIILLGAMLFTGCGSETLPTEKDRISVVCTTFPQYDWVKNLLGAETDAFEVSLLVKNSSDIHNYQPSAQDMIAIKEADLFVYVGGESDAWVADLIASDAQIEDKSVSLVGAIGDKALVEEIVEGMQHDHEHSHEEGDHDHEEEGMDEHVWLSLENAEILCRYLADRLTLLSPEYAEQIAENTSAYIEELHALDIAYRKVAEMSAHTPLIFGDRFPFRYLTEDYELEYYAAFAGCNAEVEASFDTIITLAGKVAAYEVPCILVIDGSDKSLAKSILEAAGESNKKILTLDSMQSVSMDDINAGASYLGIMRANLEILREALK